MTNHQNLMTLKLQKQHVETVLLEQEKHAGAPLPEPYETEFWQYDQKRVLNNFLNFLKKGAMIYFCFALFMIVRNFNIIPEEYFAHDFWLSLFSTSNGALCLLMMVFIARSTRLQKHFRYLAMLLTGWMIFVTSVVTLSQFTPSIQQQFIFIAFVFIFGYIVIGVKPLQMLLVGLIATAAVLGVLITIRIEFESFLLLRILVGSNVLGFIFAKIINHQERMSFLKTKLIEIDQQILKSYNFQLLQLSQNDSLTSLANRRSLDDALERYYAIAQENQQSLAVIFIDIDYFKLYNDHYGHLQGDAVLRRIARALKKAIRDRDFIGRYGGEEFVAILPKTELDQAHQVALRMSKAIDDLQIYHEKSAISSYVTISVGIAVYQPERPILLTQLLSFADQALYRAKARGRHQICRHEFPEPNTVLQKKAT